MAPKKRAAKAKPKSEGASPAKRRRVTAAAEQSLEAQQSPQEAGEAERAAPEEEEKEDEADLGIGSNAPPPPQAEEAQAAAEASSSSSDSSDDESDSSSESSESSSSSEEESEAGEAVESEVGEEEEEPAEAEPPKVDVHAVLKSVFLRRSDVLWFIDNLPADEARSVVERSFVRIVLQTGCLIAQVAGVVPSDKPYIAHRKDDGTSKQTLHVQLKCARADAKRDYKITHLSNQNFTEEELESWKRYVEKRTALPAEKMLVGMTFKAQSIEKARNYDFSEDVVRELMKTKPTIEFAAQKESRMLSAMQCAVSQMELAGMKDNDASELEERYRQALENLNVLGDRAVKHQEEWFEKRPSLYGLKEINAKNLRRQSRRDVRALDYVQKMESGVREGLNPFERRPCRPVSAWDTTLTELPAA